MKKIIGLFLALVICLPVPARQKTKANRKALVQAIAVLTAKIDSLRNVVDTLERKCVPVRKEIDPAWEKWQDVRYNYGLDPEEQPIYNTVDGILESTSMLSVRGGRGRWHSNGAKLQTSFVDGSHLFEGWNGTETCRLTMLIGKQAPERTLPSVPAFRMGQTWLRRPERRRGFRPPLGRVVRAVLSGSAG